MKFATQRRVAQASRLPGMKGQLATNSFSAAPTGATIANNALPWCWFKGNLYPFRHVRFCHRDASGIARPAQFADRQDACPTLRLSNRSEDCFTLLEVMIATALFFMVAFSVLALVSQSLQQARALKGIRTPLSSLAAQASITNKLEEGVDSGDFGDIFPGYEWSKETILFQSNDLYEVHLTVSRKGVPDSESEMTILLFDDGGARPQRRGPIRTVPRGRRR